MLNRLIDKDNFKNKDKFKGKDQYKKLDRNKNNNKIENSFFKKRDKENSFKENNL
jgi:hypothetical protein